MPPSWAKVRRGARDVKERRRRLVSIYIFVNGTRGETKRKKSVRRSHDLGANRLERQAWPQPRRLHAAIGNASYMIEMITKYI